MNKHKLNLIVDRYSVDKGFIPFIVFPIIFGILFSFGIIKNLIYLIPAILCVLLVCFMIYKMITIKRKINKNELITVSIKGFESFIKETQETSRSSALLIKLYILDEDNKKYNYYYLNGSKSKFKEYKNIINESNEVKLILFKDTNIISSLIVDGVKLDDLYQEVRYSKKLLKPKLYNHFKYNRTKKAIFKYEEYDVNDVKMVFEKASLYEELTIINKDNKYVKISYNQETHDEFLIDNTKFKTFNDMLKELEVNNFIFDGNLRVIYTLANTEPSSFIELIDKVSK